MWCRPRVDNGIGMLGLVLLVSTHFALWSFLLLPYTAHYLVLSGTCYASACGVVEFHVFYVQMWITDPEVDSRLSGHVLRPHISGSHLFGASPDEYMIWIFWEPTSGIISVCSALGSTVDTCSCQSTMLWRVSHYVNVNSDPEVTPWLSLSTETGTHSVNCAAALPEEMAQVQFLDNLLTRYVQRHARCFARQVHYWSRQCMWRFCSCLSSQVSNSCRGPEADSHGPGGRCP